MFDNIKLYEVINYFEYDRLLFFRKKMLIKVDYRKGTLIAFWAVPPLENVDNLDLIEINKKRA